MTHPAPLPSSVTETPETDSDRVSEERLREILDGCEGVTPGPWDVWREATPTREHAIAELAHQVNSSEPFAEAVYLLNANGKCPATTGCGPTSEANAAHIARLDPATVASMASELLSIRTTPSLPPRSGEVVKFVRQVLEWAYDGIDPDGEDIQRLGVETGLLLKVTYDPDKHDLPEWLKGDVEPGDDYFEFSPALRSALADPIPEAPADEEVASAIAAEVMGNDHLRHLLDEQQCEEVHGDVQEIVLRALRRSTETDKPGVREAAGDDEMYEIGKRDGYEEAVQDIDLMTGGDGEYRVAVFLGGGVDEDRHCPDPAAMKARIAERFVALSAPLTEEQPVATEVVEALRPFAQAFAKADDPGVSDLYDEQPFSLHVPLGAWRRARSAWRKLAAPLGLDTFKPNLVADTDKFAQRADIDGRQPEQNLNVAAAQIIDPVGGVEQSVNNVLRHDDEPPAIDGEQEYVDGFPISSPGGRV